MPLLPQTDNSPSVFQNCLPSSDMGDILYSRNVVSSQLEEIKEIIQNKHTNNNY